jgi:hydroxyacylglutathione hydrolase
MIQIEIFFAKNELRNFSYIVIDKNSGDCWVIDPYDDKALSHYIKKKHLVLKGILNTHQHWDHIRGNSALVSEFHCLVYGSEAELALSDQHSIQILKSPGHTPDHLCFCWKENGISKGLFSGDTLFNSGVGNCHGGGNVDELFETVQRLKEMPDEVVLYPGHDYVHKNLLFAQQWEPDNNQIKEALKYVESTPSEKGLQWTLGQEKAVNPFLRLDSSEIRQNLSQQEKKCENHLESERIIFRKLRSLRDQW